MICNNARKTLRFFKRELMTGHIYLMNGGSELVAMQETG